MKTPVDTSFIHDLSQLDSLRQKAVGGEDSPDALRAAAEQFEAIFTQMLFKSMREANSAFESGLTDNRTSKFYEQMADEQLSSSLSREGSLGLADLIVQQLGGAASGSPGDTGASRPAGMLDNSVPGMLENRDVVMKNAAMESSLRLPVSPESAKLAADRAVDMVGKDNRSNAHPLPAVGVAGEKPAETFTSPEEFVSKLAPYAKKAARTLGADPAILIAQAALETGWGKKVISNARGNSHNLFNIKADPRWEGNKVATRTLEVYDGVPVQENASFRAYPSYQDSFDDYVRFLNTNPRYQQALDNSANPDQFIRDLHQAGYATDPQYADKVLSVLDRVQGLM